MRQRVPGTSPIQLWNVRRRTLDGEPRTNDSVEGFHNALQSSITNAYPTLWKLIDCLQKEEAPAAKKKVDNSTETHLSRPKYQKPNGKLLYMVQDYDSKDPIRFLEQIAACMHTF